MFTAAEKEKNNIAEYILYMYQLEDLIRACNFDIALIQKNIIQPQAKSDSFFNEATRWYEEIIREMQSRGLEKKGHLHRITEVFMELVYLHDTLLGVVKDEKYKTLYETAKPHIEEFRQKSNIGQIHDLEVAFHALYMKLLMKLKKQDISSETEESFDHMRILLAYISRAYHKMKKGESLV
jgi:hypothetical protein